MPAVINVRKKRNPKREPKNIEELRQRYHRKKYFNIKKAETELKSVFEISSRTKRIIGKEYLEKKGKGVVFVFPMTSVLGHGEFMRGMLKVLAPKAKVHFLLTPKHPTMLTHDFERSQYGPRIKESMKKIAVHKPKKIIVIDEIQSGKTIHAIKTAAKELGLPSSQKNFVAEDSYYIGTHVSGFYQNENRSSIRLGWEKLDSGKAAGPKEDIRSINVEVKPTKRILNRSRKTSAKLRRFMYNLGIATAREYEAIRRGEKK